MVPGKLPTHYFITFRSFKKVTLGGVSTNRAAAKGTCLLFKSHKYIQLGEGELKKLGTTLQNLR